jgi:thiamine-monophosphate kinase
MTDSRTDADRAARPGEFELIAELFAPLAASAPGAFGLSDDVAVLAPPAGHDVVLKTDAVVESVDFFRDDPASAIARKALRVNLSDLAAKGAQPAGYLLTLLLPDWPDRAWLTDFAAGLAADQAEFGFALMGGDTSSTSGALAISIAAFGYVPRGAVIRRAGAKAGDAVFVSGSIGDAGGGLAVRKGDAPALSHPELVARYRVPEPRLALGLSLRGLARAALDISDGLIADLGHLAASSHVRIEIDAPRVPLSAALRALWGDGLDAVCRAVTAGDDYEIAFAAPPAAREAVRAAAAKAGVAVTEIGRAVAGEGVALLDAGGSEIALPRKGFAHF